MCGIAGFFQTAFDFRQAADYASKLNAMKQSLRHRGPDEESFFLTAHAGLAHTRLSIIDIKGGKQPMKKHHAVLCYNGELYNASELRHYLKPYGLPFVTDSDTEVILNGYLAEGISFLSKLNGIFAFAIYDEKQDTILLVRDRLGVKPLFYTIQDNILVFGSEQKALFAYGILPKADDATWCEIFGTGPAHTPGHGVFSDIHELLPGHLLLAGGDGFDLHLRSHAYWSLKAKEHTDTPEETKEIVSSLVYDSVKRQMVSDIPICTFLSGGLDSSLVSAICAAELKKQGKTLHTYSFDFVGNRENFVANAFQSSQDRPFATKMVEHIKSHHIFLECDNEIQADYLNKAVDARDLPCMADVESSLLYFCSEVAKHQRVALTGECADEIFGGYPWFHKKEMREQNTFPWSTDLSTRTALLKEDVKEQVQIDAYVRNAYQTAIAQTPCPKEADATERRFREISWLNLSWFMMTLLNRMDRTSMYSGLEARVPFADHRILEYVYNIPWELKCEHGQTKSLLVHAGKNLLPEEVLYRKKSPYPKTYDPAYESLLKERLLDLLASPQEPLLKLLDKEKLLAFLNSPSDYGKPWYGQLMAGPQMIAYLLQINYWMQKYHL